MRMDILAAIAVVTVALFGTVPAQEAPPAFSSGQERPSRGMGVGGQITAIEGTTITLQTFHGETAKVKITSSTRFMKDREEAKISDFKVGDRVFAAGEQGKDGVWTAQALRARSGEPGAGRGGMGGGQAKPEDNGKSYILGVVTKISGTQLTVKKPDNAEQVIEADDDTSFRNERRESVTLADVKVGDFVRGQGEVKNGVFVPIELIAGKPRGPRMGAMAPPDGAPHSQVAPGSAAPNSVEPDSSDQKK